MELYRGSYGSTTENLAQQHVDLLHGDGAARQRVVIAQVDSQWRQRSYPVGQLAEVLPRLVGREDVYISQGRFWGFRREVAQLAGISALWVDIDSYNIAHLREMHPFGVLKELLDELARGKIPEPSLAISSGRGLYCLWLHSEIPRQAIPRWRACQARLCEVLHSFGSDPRAQDAARVLRLAGTVNSKSSTVVEVLHPPGEVWSFDDLADEILPLTREELAEVRDLRIARAIKRPNRKRAWTSGKGLNVAQLWEDRLSDLQLLLRVRWDSDELPEGQRNAWLLIAASGMSWLVPPDVMRREINALAREVAHYPDGETRDRVWSVMRRAQMAERGEMVEYDGRRVDPRYRWTNKRIVELLEITATEETHLRTLISTTEKNRRRREKRRLEGALSQKNVSERAANRRKRVRSLASAGRTPQEIASIVGLSIHTVGSYLWGRR